MRKIQKTISLLLALCLLLGNGMIAVRADEDPQAMKDLKTFGAAMPEEAAQQEALPAETEAVPAATEAPVSPETLPTETVSLAAAPEQDPTEEAAPQEVTAEDAATSAKKASGQTGDTSGKWEPEGHSGVPLYFQTDYPDNLYGVGTIASNGCGAVCLSMVASYMTGHDYTPEEIARYFGGEAGNNIARLELGSEALQLPFHKAENWHETLAALKDGKVVIALMDSESIFTQSQHFIVLTGMTEDGKILVNDPYEPNYSKWDLKKGMQYGFDSSAILLGYSGAWIYDKDAMPEDPYIYYKPLPVHDSSRYDFQLTQEERQLLAKVIWVEARGESREGQQAVAEVIFNRMASGDFPDTLRDIVYGQGQFVSVEFLEDAEPSQTQYEAIDSAYYGEYVLPEDVVYFATSAKTSNIWGEIGGHVFCYAED